jgi:hypothetical protein
MPVLILVRFVCIWFLALIGMAQSSLAQSSNLSPREFVSNLLQQMRIDDISEDPARVIVRTKRLHRDGQSAPGLLIICDRTRPGHEFLVVQDHTLLTDDRLVVGSGFCDAMLALTRQHQTAQ